jgi:transcriptional regulator with PAS, ATPase and Fis domain
MTIHHRTVLIIDSTELRAHHAEGYTTVTISLNNAWSEILAIKPDVVVIECGQQLSLLQVPHYHELLVRIKERHKGRCLTALALTAPESLAYAGEIIYGGVDTQEAHGAVDALIASPPLTRLDLPTLEAQITDLLSYCTPTTEAQRENLETRSLGDATWAQSIVDPKSRSLWHTWLPRYAQYNNENPVIVGETGTGKTNFAAALHHHSGRKGAFVATTPRDFSSPELMHAELFGTVVGAFTGATERWGLVKSAEGGTLFIDELQSIDRELQGKLITFIEQKKYRRVGATESITADVRFIFASNTPLEKLRSDDILREDFAYRLERMELNMLPLRERPLDIAGALAYSLAKIRRQRPTMSSLRGLSPSAYALMFTAPWPGNIRQLDNMLARSCEYADIRGDSLVHTEAVQAALHYKSKTHDDLRKLLARQLAQTVEDAIITSTRPPQEILEELLEQMIPRALTLSEGDIARAATLLNCNTSVLKLWIERAAL